MKTPPVHPPLFVRPIVIVAHTHDDYAWFRVWFTVATVTASIVFNLGIFALLVFVHMILDIIKYRTKHNLSWRWTAVETIRESLFDVFFIALGLLLAILFHHTLAIGGLGKLARVEVMMLDFIITVGPRFKIAENLMEVVLYWKHHFTKQFAPLEPLSNGEKTLSFMTCLIIAVIFLLPQFTSLTTEQWIKMNAAELTPRLEFNLAKTLEEIQHTNYNTQQ